MVADAVLLEMVGGCWCCQPGSPEGAVMATPSRTGVPKFGVPSAFQVNFCARVERFMSQPPLAELLA